jgi:integrase
MKIVTPFMESLHKLMREKRNITESTASQYLRSLYSMNSSRPFNNLGWLKTSAPVEARIAEYAKSTQKTMYSTIVAALTTMNNTTYTKIRNYYFNKMMELSAKDRERDTSVKTEKQEKNWLDWHVVVAHEERLKQEAEQFLKNKVVTPKEWSVILSWLVLSLYTKFPPRRNVDYQHMYVVAKEKNATDGSKNYFTLDTEKFIFNKYKTASKHGAQTFPVPPELLQVIERYLSKHPLRKQGEFPLLTNADGEPFTSVNFITRILNKIFGLNLGATMLRHIYLSNKYDITEMNQDSEEMGHTGSMQREYLKS